MPSDEPVGPELSDFQRGVIVGILIGEGHFGGDGRQPQITIKMHVRHESLLRWLMKCFPRTKMYGPYSYDGRTFYQWMARGRALVEDVLPILDEIDFASYDVHAHSRLETMRSRYGSYISRITRT